MSELTIGIVGCGAVSETHLNNLKDLSQYSVKTLADISPEQAKMRAGEFGVANWTTDYREILADNEIEAVFVLTPPSIHAQIAIEAFEAGKHVFCEKPLSRNSEQCRALVKAAETTDRVFLLGYPMRHSKDALNLCELIQSGRIGRPVFFRDIWGLCLGSLSPAIHDAEQGGGVLYEHTHWLDFVNRIFGPAQKVYASMSRFKPDDTTADDTFIAIMDFQSGDQAVWSESWAAPGFGWDPVCVGRNVRPTLDVIGPKGSLHFPDAEGNQVLSLYENHTDKREPAEQWTWEFDWAANSDGYKNELVHFYNCIRNDEKPLCTAPNGLDAILLAEAILKSHQTGQPVEL
jgi:predicted dehydrogenase